MMSLTFRYSLKIGLMGSDGKDARKKEKSRMMSKVKPKQLSAFNFMWNIAGITSSRMGGGIEI